MASKGPQCSICSECYDDKKKCPRLLYCGHSFCSSCLETLLHGKNIACPTCRNPIVVPTGVQGLLKNFALLDFVEKAHKTGSPHCPEHNDQEFRYFDEDCGCVICIDCHTLNHNGHKCVTLAEAASKSRKEMEALVTKASSQAKKIKVAEDEVKKAAAFMKKVSDERRAEMQGFFRELHAALNDRQHVLMDKLVGLLQHKESILTEQLNRLQVNQTFLEGVVQQANASIQSPSDVQFLLSVSDIVSTLETEESYSLVLEPEAQFLPEFAKQEKSPFSGKAGFLSPLSQSLEEAIQSAGAISDRSTCAEKATAIGPGIIGANPGRKATFTITSRDSQNCQRELGGDVYVVKLKANEGGPEFKVDVKDRDEGTYLAEYTVPDKLFPSPCGQYTLSVCLRGAHIKGSPFSVQVTRP